MTDLCPVERRRVARTANVPYPLSKPMTTLTADTMDLSLSDFDAIDAVFSIKGEDMRTHRGRSVVAVTVEGQRHFLKRFWFDRRQPLKRNVARGMHELKMIDWLCNHGFRGPNVVRQGLGGAGLFSTRMFFLMREMPGERPLETAWRVDHDNAKNLLWAVGELAARLHDAGFCHVDFSERHIFVGGTLASPTFRLIDVEWAKVGRIDERQCACDLATLAASISDQRLRDAIRTTVVNQYIRKRKTLADNIDFRTLFERAKPTKSF